ncbi:MAG: alkaline phosphatase family protein [Candidatus Latescibacterota bacterium]|nr:MAG: alkaline phosphatase family protein [Candidatus Latescibacterota bacterium]
MAFKLFGRKTKKACVIGLDGVPYTLLKSMIERGVMPVTGEIISRGSLSSMTVTLPEISSVSWSTFMTGKNPGEHGIFGFTDLKDGSYDLRFPSFRDLKTETIWDLLGKTGGRSIVINQPSTYPAREIPGVLISGFVAIDIEKALYPKKYLASLARARYKIDIDTEKCRDNPDLLFKDLDALLECRRRVLDELWTKEPWNIMEIVVTGTDRLHHFVWDAWEDESHPHHQDFLGYYRKVDQFIGYVYSKFEREDTPENFFMLSDHGFCQTKKEVHINTVLEQHGFLDMETGDSADLTRITENARAFALDPARIYIHRRSRYPKGRVDERDVAGIKEELKGVFESLADDGAAERRPIIRQIFDADEVYSGPHAAMGPDLLLLPNNGYDLKGKVGGSTMVAERRLQGMHTWDNAFFFSLRNDLSDTSDELQIVDVPWKILRSVDVGA